MLTVENKQKVDKAFERVCKALDKKHIPYSIKDDALFIVPSMSKLNDLKAILDLESDYLDIDYKVN